MPITCQGAPVRGMKYEEDFLWDYIEKLQKQNKKLEEERDFAWEQEKLVSDETYKRISEKQGEAEKMRTLWEKKAKKLTGHYHALKMVQKYAETKLCCSLSYELDEDEIDPVGGSLSFDFDKIHNFHENLDLHAKYVGKLKKENKKQKEDYNEWEKESLCSFSELKEENRKLKEDYNELFEERESLCSFTELNQEMEKLKEENKKLKDYQSEVDNMENGLVADYPEISEEWRYYEIPDIIKKLKEEINQATNEYKETKYDGDDWAYGYGFTVKDGEYRISMAGGGDHWFDYVMNKNGCFIHNKDGMKKVKTFISCPEGNYTKCVSIGEDYFLDDGENETDMYEMVKECYEEKIMNYQEEE